MISITKTPGRINFFEIYPKADYEFICLQNVRSIAMHKLDVLSDPIMMASSVICLTETALSCDDWNGWKNFESYDIYQTCRKDAHQNPDINQRKSGGVAILVNKEIQSYIDPFNKIENLEMTNTDISICGVSLSINLIYKDHIMPRKEFLKLLKQLFRNKMHLPSIILGDFNINTLEDSDLMGLAIEHKFESLVQNSTTINGNILDQIYVCNFPFLVNCEVVTMPSYFSDHDLVVLCVPKGDIM